VEDLRNSPFGKEVLRLSNPQVEKGLDKSPFEQARDLGRQLASESSFDSSPTLQDTINTIAKLDADKQQEAATAFFNAASATESCRLSPLKELQGI